MHLWLCLRFRQLPLQSLTRDEESPIAVIERQRVLRCNSAAGAAGVRESMDPATARALCDDPAITLLPRDPQREHSALLTLGQWAYSITPTLYPWRGDCLLLEIGRCLRLAGGLESLLQRVDLELARRMPGALRAVAETPKAAWLLSFAGEAQALQHRLPIGKRLAPLPLGWLEPLCPEVSELARTGLTTVGDLLALPRPSLGRRAGPGLVRLLDELLGSIREPVADFPAPAYFDDGIDMDYGVTGTEELRPYLERLLRQFCRFLTVTQQQARQIEWLLQGEQGQGRRLTVGCTEPGSSWDRWYELSALQFERPGPAITVTRLRLRCTALEPMQLPAGDLFRSPQRREPLQALYDRLVSRLGREAVRQAELRSEHLPEHATRLCDQVRGYRNRPPGGGIYPFWLLSRPEPLTMSTAEGAGGPAGLELLLGPERVEDRWWDGPESRDYFVARSESGELFWVYRDRRQGHWYRHGWFS